MLQMFSLYFSSLLNIYYTCIVQTLFICVKISCSKIYTPHLLARDNFPSNVPDKTYLFKLKDKDTRKRCEICLKLTIKTPKQRQQNRSGVFIVNFKHISHFFLVFLLLILNK